MFWIVLRYESQHDSAVWKILLATTITRNTLSRRLNLTEAVPFVSTRIEGLRMCKDKGDRESQGPTSCFDEQLPFKKLVHARKTDTELNRVVKIAPKTLRLVS